MMTEYKQDIFTVRSALSISCGDWEYRDVTIKGRVRCNIKKVYLRHMGIDEIAAKKDHPYYTIPLQTPYLLPA